MDINHPNYFNPYIVCCKCLTLTKDYDYFTSNESNENDYYDEYAICERCLPFIRERGFV